MKSKFLVLISSIFLIFLLNSVSAVVVYGDWEDENQSIQINLGESVDFNANFFSMNPPMTLNIKLYDLGDNLVHSFESNRVASTNGFAQTYTITNAVYQRAGNFKVVLSGQDASLNSDSYTLNLVVRDTNQGDTTPPIIDIISPINGTTYTSHITSINYTATDTNLASCWYTLDNSATNIGVPCNTLITGISSVQGANTWTIYANDLSGNIASRTITFNVNIPGANNPPVITSTAVTSVNESTAYSYDVDATDADNDVLIYSLTTAPGWLSINSATGLISGTAPSVTADENYAVIVSVSDSTDSAIQIFTLVVRETGVIIPDTTPPVINIISPINLANYTSHIISINYTATDANLATCWYSLDNGVTNINVACNSLITGITSVEGSNTWTIYANDTSGNIASQTVTFTVDLPGGNTIPVITSTPITSVNEKAHYSYHVTATDADGNALTYSLVSAPNWLSINSATGLITGTAPSVSSDTNYAITVAVFDGTASVTQSYVLRVYNVSGGNNKGNGAGGETSASDLEFEEQQYLDQFGPRAAISAEDETASTGNILKSKSWLLISLVVLGIILIIALIIFLISLLG